MKIVFFSHPTFLGSQSMPRFTRMLAEGMKESGHEVEVWAPKPRLNRLPAPASIKKWLGYLDQYIIFPAEVRKRLKHYGADTLFVFTDHALGPWVPLVAERKHVIHCHDFLAQLSALGHVPENPTSWTGKLYQAYIRKGYTQGKHFISVSEKTREELHKLLHTAAVSSDVVYNGLNGDFAPLNRIESRAILGKHIRCDLTDGFILHVGGNEWYKNRIGVLEIYNAWRESSSSAVPLLMVGHNPSPELLALQQQSSYKRDIHWLVGLADEQVKLAYTGAKVLLFPSLAEGFGWPIAEAMASGCPVITTNEAPMTEVAAKAGYYIPRRPANKDQAKQWASDAAIVLDNVVHLSEIELNLAVKQGLVNSQRFSTTETLKRIEEVYHTILETDKHFIQHYAAVQA
ncbi:glycosyltransferase [uncultured Pontibacter sp.]|uniref:glycosyltransferase n=1 Tax=uncultured Pontibacter sp. TaxID=453356 RepID=UPI0026185F2F|nr:glycosyltransferase [uncultured Pontibacter sp.]